MIKEINSYTKMVAIEDSKLLIVYGSWLAKIQRLINKIFRQSFVAVVNPLTCTLHVSDKVYFDKCPYWLINHEFIHVMQVLSFGRLRFLLFYVIYSIRYGYRKNPLEEVAYDNQMMFNYNDVKSYIDKIHKNRYKLIFKKEIK